MHEYVGSGILAFGFRDVLSALGVLQLADDARMLRCSERTIRPSMIDSSAADIPAYAAALGLNTAATNPALLVLREGHSDRAYKTRLELHPYSTVSAY